MTLNGKTKSTPLEGQWRVLGANGDIVAICLTEQDAFKVAIALCSRPREREMQEMGAE